MFAGLVGWFGFVVVFNLKILSTTVKIIHICKVTTQKHLHLPHFTPSYFLFAFGVRTLITPAMCLSIIQNRPLRK